MKVNSVLQNQIDGMFFQLLVDIRNKEEAMEIMSDFLKPKEFNDLSKRLAVIYWLKKNRSIENVKTNLGVSIKEIKETAKIKDKKGLVLAIKKIESEEWASKWSERIKNVIRK